MRLMILLRRGYYLPVNPGYGHRHLAISSNSPAGNAVDPFPTSHRLDSNPGIGSVKTDVEVQGDEFEKPRPGRMRAWQFHDYAGIDGLSMATNVRVPALKNPTDVLVKVHAASVNPVDIKMLSGYGSNVLNTMRKASKLQPNLVEFPLTPGRDFAGTVVDVGRLTRGLRVGDRVYGTPAPHWQGSHAEYVLAPSITVQKIPKELTYVEAASLPYAFMTLYSALTLFGDFWIRKPSEERVLVVGASGGIGTLAVQTLKAWGAEVCAVCSSDAVEMVESLGADQVFDYTNPSWIDDAKRGGLYDMVLDCATSGSSGGPDHLTQLVKKWRFGRYVTLTPPILRETDERGLINGALRLGTSFARSNISSLLSGAKSVRWAFYVPHPRALAELNSLIERGQLRPIVRDVYKFEDAPAAYTRVADGKTRGKIVLAVTSDAKSAAKTGTRLNDGRNEFSGDRDSTRWSATAGDIAGTLGETVGGQFGAGVGHNLGKTVGGAIDTSADLAENFSSKLSGTAFRNGGKSGVSEAERESLHDSSAVNSAAEHSRHPSQLGTETVREVATNFGASKHGGESDGGQNKQTRNSV